MELRQLRSLVAVAEEGQFALAARRLYLSPAAVTAHIARLERELGTVLLDRHPVAPTPAGHRFLRHARTMLDAERAAMEDVAALGHGRGKVLRIGVMAHGSAEITPAVIDVFARSRPQVRISLTALNFREHVSALLDHRVDVAFVRPAPQDERVESDVVTTESRIVVVSARSGVAEAGAVRAADVLELPYVDLPTGTMPRFADFMYFNDLRNGERPRRSPDVATTPHEVLVSAALGRGTGSSLHSFERYYRWPGTVCVPVVDAPAESSVLTVRRGDTSPDVAAFRSVAARLARSVGDGLSPESPAHRC
ncbi:LysR family transcriptional regulator [Streptomyces winkii]|uniref:LysR family transcriptional regulator n=1 Tax=Streptomyces winkii TaxID=3051178 RepID=UPI0028D5BD24|nr:LysR family transcriptional regulator [Streptomyces sp. DSM 40971]